MILIVDDQKYTGTVLERLLRYTGHPAVCVTGGVDALAMLHLRKPALVILDQNTPDDVNTPETDGLTVLRSIKEHDEFKDVPVLMYSTETKWDTILEAKRLGAVDFFIKGSNSYDVLITQICKFAGEPVT